jgi:hypothetical protein
MLKERKGLMDLQYDFAKKAKPLPPSRNNSKAKENSV